MSQVVATIYCNVYRMEFSVKKLLLLVLSLLLLLLVLVLLSLLLILLLLLLLLLQKDVCHNMWRAQTALIHYTLLLLYYYYLKEEWEASTCEAKKCQSPPGIGRVVYMTNALPPVL